jgi:hypothetical protein
MIAYTLIQRRNGLDTIIMIFEDKDLVQKICDRLNNTTQEIYSVEPHTFIPKNHGSKNCESLGHEVKMNECKFAHDSGESQ